MSTPALKQLLAQQAELAARIKLVKETGQAERTSAITQIKKLIADFDIEKSEVFDPNPVAIRYRGPEADQTWTGRGFRPKWLQAQIDMGVPLESFAVSVQ
jgi:DNA-binding protein H-NS